jgi:hypothetical protein
VASPIRGIGVRLGREEAVTGRSLAVISGTDCLKRLDNLECAPRNGLAFLRAEMVFDPAPIAAILRERL